jgi:hypothetical protein
MSKLNGQNIIVTKTDMIKLNIAIADNPAKKLLAVSK